MKLFQCQGCGNAIHFENFRCMACGRKLGYAPDRQSMVAVEAVEETDSARQLYVATGAPHQRYYFCDNAERGICNWLSPEGGAHSLCRSCRHTRIAPDLSVAGNLERWARLEHAKRQLFYSLLLWDLPTPMPEEGAWEPLVFDLLGDIQTDYGVQKILTGHDFGRITLNIAEADDDAREQRRVALGEPYRTMIGHFRHEIGHYYWDLLVRDGGRLDDFRALFGDERADYEEALKAHYANGAPPGWQEYCISAYATSHPWEDFAETWAHYMHIVDTLETAGSLGIALEPRHFTDRNLQTRINFDAYQSHSIDEILQAWTPVSIAINSLTRSLGQRDAYPFVLARPVVQKMAFIHQLIRSQNIDKNIKAEDIAAE